MIEHRSSSLADTRRIATALAAELRGGDCVALDGPMGAGKTTLVRCLVAALGGVERDVSSPTFALLNIYDTRALRVFHLDAYRVAGEEDFEAIGFDELLDQGGVVIVEWPSRVSGLIPADAVRVTIEVIDQSSRVVRWELGRQ